MDRRIPLLLLLLLLILAVDLPTVFAKTLDPYKVLGVDKSATQREIQKAFHKLSLQYHPDKNKSKSAKEKFTEINNAYEILSDEEKRKNYDLYGDETGRPSFDAGDVRNGNGYTHFTSGPGSDYFTSSSGGYQRKGGEGNTQSFSFSFGGPDTGGMSSGFDFGDMFSNIFGAGSQGGRQFGGFSGSGGPNSGFSSSVDIKDVDMQFFNKKIKGQGLTWLLLVYTPSAKGYHVFDSMLEDVASSLSGALKAGRINCQNEQTLCKDLGVSSSRAARLFVYINRGGEKGSLVEYSGDLDSRSLKNFCQDQLPRFSKRIDLRSFDFSSSTISHRPQVLLLSTKDTPVMWRAVSGLYHDRLVFYDAEVHDISDPLLKKLGVDALPAVVGKSVDGEIHVLRTGITMKDLKSGINELSALLGSFEKKNKKAASSQARRPSERESKGEGVPSITDANFDSLCGEKTTVCIIGVYRSSKAKSQLEALLSAISQKTYTRRQPTESVTYTLLDAGKHAAFLNAFDRSGYKSLDKLLVAYKPKRGRFAVFTGQMIMEEVEKFTSSVLNGDVRFSQVRQKPVVSQDEDSWRIQEWIDALRGMGWWRWLAQWF